MDDEDEFYDVAEHLDEAETEDLVNELENRGWTCISDEEQAGKFAVSEYMGMSGVELRKHLTDITHQPLVTDTQDIFSKLADLLNH